MKKLLTSWILKKANEQEIIDELFSRLNPITILHLAKMRSEYGYDIIVKPKRG